MMHRAHLEFVTRSLYTLVMGELVSLWTVGLVTWIVNWHLA